MNKEFSMARQVITFHYELKDDAGSTIDSSRQGEPLTFLEGAGQIIPGLEPALVGLEKGKLEKIFVEANDAYGPYDQSLVTQLPRAQFPKSEIKSGDIFEVQKSGHIHLITVVEVTDDQVTVDANHPLAGKNLTFFVEVTSRRDATSEEISHGHAHSDHHPHSH
jgi:FKBP-type peptidyl-prolyl cis-trans isomerase SlyD